MFTREPLRDWGFEVVDGAAVRIKDVRVDAPSVAPSVPATSSPRPAPQKRPRKPRVVPVDAFDRALQVDGWRSGDILYLLYLTLAIPPRTKKNHKEWHGRESAAYRTFRRRVMNAIQLVKRGPVNPEQPAPWRAAWPAIRPPPEDALAFVDVLRWRW